MNIMDESTLVAEKQNWRRNPYFFIILGTCLISVIVLWYAIGLGIIFPPQFAEEKVIEIQAGLGARDVADILFQDGIIRQPTYFL